MRFSLLSALRWALPERRVGERGPMARQGEPGPLAPGGEPGPPARQSGTASHAEPAPPQPPVASELLQRPGASEPHPPPDGRVLAPGRLVLASHNAGKLAELRALLPPGYEVVSAGELGLPEPPETGATFRENAAIKALAAARATGLPALADDSGLMVAALAGAPGVHTADWAIQPDGSRDYAAAMARVAREAGDGAADAAFVSTLALAWPDGALRFFEGRVGGRWVWPPRGQGGFGYDPMFEPEGAGQTFGEMTPAGKRARNHRARAFAEFAKACLPPTSGG